VEAEVHAPKHAVHTVRITGHALESSRRHIASFTLTGLWRYGAFVMEAVGHWPQTS